MFRNESNEWSLIEFQLFGEEQSQGRGQGGEPDVHMHDEHAGRGERAQGIGQGNNGELDEPGGRGQGDRRTVPGVHGGPDHVRDTVQHGPVELAVLENRRPTDGLGVRRVLDAHHDPDRVSGAGEARLVRGRLLRQSVALGRQAGRRYG